MVEKLTNEALLTGLCRRLGNPLASVFQALISTKFITLSDELMLAEDDPLNVVEAWSAQVRCQ